MKEASENQAISMARFAEIELRPQQIKDYVEVRESKESIFVSECDQVLLDLCLDHNQEIKFRKKFDNIFNNGKRE